MWVGARNISAVEAVGECCGYEWASGRGEWSRRACGGLAVPEVRFGLLSRSTTGAELLEFCAVWRDDDDGDDDGGGGVAAKIGEGEKSIKQTSDIHFFSKGG